MTDHPLRRELHVAMEAAEAAGEIIRGWYRGDFTVHRKEEAGGSPVTEADVEANRCIESHLRSAFPEDGWLSEETADSPDRLRAARVWIVDPLDGTKEFVRQIPEFVVCIGLAIGGEAKLGVAFNPIRKEMYAGIVGAGLTCNGREASVSPRAQLSGATVYASRSEERRGEWDEFRSEFQVEVMGSVAYKLALVAVGQADATFSLTPKCEWDVCAGAALLLAGGGAISDRYGAPLRFNQPQTLLPGLVATNGRLHEPVFDLLRQRGKLADR